MDAEHRLGRWCFYLMAIASVGLSLGTTDAANFRTRNFLIHAPTPDLARAVGNAAERYRNDLAMYWTGKPLRPWPNPCPIRVVAGPNLAAQGVTTYNPAPVRDFQMEVIGTPERILDSVLPHEVTHTVLATYFGRPLPRWADEGICTTVEHDSERSKHEAKLREFLRSRRGIPMNQLFLLTEYPNDVLPMYAQGYSVCQFLIAQKGPQAFIQFLHDYIAHPSWTANVRKHYQYESLAELQKYWLEWVSAGSGPVERFAKVERPDRKNGATAIAQSNTNDSPIKQVAATEPTKQIRPQTPGRSPEAIPAGAMVAGTTAKPDPTAIAAVIPPTRSADPQDESIGWYQRQKLKKQADQGVAESAADQPVRPLVPPSVRQSGRYQSAQPQEEGGIARSGTALSSPRLSSPATAVPGQGRKFR